MATCDACEQPFSYNELHYCSCGVCLCADCYAEEDHAQHDEEPT